MVELQVAGRLGDCFGCLGYWIVAADSGVQEMDHLCCTGYYFHVDSSKLFDLGFSSSLMDFGMQNNFPDTVSQTHLGQICPQSGLDLRFGTDCFAGCLVLLHLELITSFSIPHAFPA